jgi:nucleoside-diphosphate-sugar epimerase
MKNIWVLGATGYVGKALTLELLAQKERGLWAGYRINTLGHRTMDAEIMERTNFFMSDLATLDTQWWERFPPAVVFHCARLAGSTDGARSKAARRGAQANARLIRFLEDAPWRPTVVYCSGTLMYGPQTSPATEVVSLNPVAYARHYLHAEQPWLDAQARGHLDVRMARPAWIIGPDSWFKAFFYNPLQPNRPIPYYGSGEQRMSLIHINDCAGQLIHAWTHGTPLSNYNLFSGAPIPQWEFSQMVAGLTGNSTSHVTEEQLHKQVGKTVAEALLSDIPVDTLHQTWKGAYAPQFGGVSQMVESAIQGFAKV